MKTIILIVVLILPLLSSAQNSKQTAVYIDSVLFSPACAIFSFQLKVGEGYTHPLADINPKIIDHIQTTKQGIHIITKKRSPSPLLLKNFLPKYTPLNYPDSIIYLIDTQLQEIEGEQIFIDTNRLEQVTTLYWSDFNYINTKFRFKIVQIHESNAEKEYRKYIATENEKKQVFFVNPLNTKTVYSQNHSFYVARDSVSFLSLEQAIQKAGLNYEDKHNLYMVGRTLIQNPSEVLIDSSSFKVRLKKYNAELNIVQIVLE